MPEFGLAWLWFYYLEDNPSMLSPGACAERGVDRPGNDVNILRR